MSVYAQVCRNGKHGKKIAGCVINGAKVAWKCENEETGGSFRKSGSKAKQRKGKGVRYLVVHGCGEGGGGKVAATRRWKGGSVFLCRTCFGTKTRGKWEQEQEQGRGQDLPDRAIRKALFRRGNQQDHVCSPFSRQRPCSTNTAPLSALLLLFRSSPSSCGRVLLLHRSLNLDPV